MSDYMKKKYELEEKRKEKERSKLERRIGRKAIELYKLLRKTEVL